MLMNLSVRVDEAGLQGRVGREVAEAVALQVRHFATGICEPGLETALEASLRVIRAGHAGDLPLFAATLGLPALQFRGLLRPECRNLAPDLPDALLARWLPAHFEALVALLWEHRGGDQAVIRCLARAIAAACFGERHLWQDMGFGMRGELSALVAQCFPRLHARNTTDLKWKRLLFTLLGERLGMPGLLPPACPRCASFQACFPE